MTRPRPRSSRTGGGSSSSVVSSQIDLHAQYGGVVPEIASRAHVELINHGRSPTRSGGRRRADRPRRDRRVSRAGARGRAARRRQRSEGARARHRSPVRAGEPSRGAPLRGVARGPRARARRSPCSSRRVVTRCSSSSGSRRLRGARTDGRRRRRRGVRQGRRASSASGIRAVPRSTVSRAAATAAAIPFPRAMADESDFSFSGLKTAVVHVSCAEHPDDAGRRRRRVVPGGGRRPADVRSCSRSPSKRGARRSSLGGGVAANSRLRERVTDAAAA